MTRATFGSDNNRVTYTYDGLRVRKTVNGVVTHYTLNGTLYTYVYSLQGDVVALLDAGGNVVVEYKYDAWGNIVARTGSLFSTLGYLNPFRYRGYVYDEETGLYYLKSRYFRPEWGRFIIPDSYFTQNKKELITSFFEYCYNNAVSYVDSNGYKPTVFYFYLNGINDVEITDNDLRLLYSDYSVRSYEFASSSEFERYWEEATVDAKTATDGIIVYIETHGGADCLSDINMDSIKFQFEIDLLVLASCHGLEYNAESCTSSAMHLLRNANGNIKSLIATDGLVGRNYGNRMGCFVSVPSSVSNAEIVNPSFFTLYKKDRNCEYIPCSHGQAFDNIIDLFNMN